MINEHYPRISESLAEADVKFPELLAASYPRILKRVDLLWGTKEATDYFESIFLGDSEDRSERQGFPVEILKEIVNLRQAHDFLFPSININPYDPFSGYTMLSPTKESGATDISNNVDIDCDGCHFVAYSSIRNKINMCACVCVCLLYKVKNETTIAHPTNWQLWRTQWR